MSLSQPTPDLREKLYRHLTDLGACQADVEAYLTLQQGRFEQLTRRYERVERQTDALTNPDTERGKRLLAEYERLGELHSRKENELDDLENVVLEALREVQTTLRHLLA
ncbi:hypothetical protein ACFFLM_15725 [Deinococcus oregonensis]|uniref:YlbF family regulator n=1 Tax=Deinococcus oregonensis TaxID=1805970 RepID=A0ABV6B3G6_9DEIO